MELGQGERICPKCKNLAFEEIATTELSYWQVREIADKSAESLNSKKGFRWAISWRLFLFIAGLLGIPGAIVGWNILNSFQSLEQSANRNLDVLRNNLSNQIETARSGITNEVGTNFQHFAEEASNRLHASTVEVTNLIVQTFQSSNITHIVQNIAGLRAGIILETEVAPAVTKFTNDVATFSAKIESLTETKRQQDLQIAILNTNLESSEIIESNLQATISDAKETLNRLDEQSKLVTTSILADHDDRNALEQLRKWPDKSAFKSLAENLAKRVQVSYYNYHGPYTLVSWNTNISPEARATLGIDEINSIWNALSQDSAKDYVDFVWGKTNIATEQRIAFLRNVYLKDSHNSLYAQTTAAAHVAEFLGVTYNPCFVFGGIEKRWTEFASTNHLFVISTNDSTDTAYDIIIPSKDTNRFSLIRDWKDAKLVLFKLRQPAVAGTISGKSLNLSNGHLEDLSLNVNYKNVVWATFNEFLDVKLEFQYKKDSSSTNVENIDVTTNELIFDHSKQALIPAP